MLTTAPRPCCKLSDWTCDSVKTAIWAWIWHEVKAFRDLSCCSVPIRDWESICTECFTELMHLGAATHSQESREADSGVSHAALLPQWPADTILTTTIFQGQPTKSVVLHSEGPAVDSNVTGQMALPGPGARVLALLLAAKKRLPDSCTATLMAALV